METIQPIPQPPQPSSKNPYKILFFVSLGLFLVISSVLITLLITQKSSKSITTADIQETEVIPTEKPEANNESVTTIPTVTTTATKDWLIYSSKELGISFKYPNSWGNPEIEKEDYRNKASELLNGEAFCLRFKDTWICGFTNDYKNYMARNSYVDPQENLDLTEVFNQEPGNIFFTKKVMVDKQKTSIKTELFYLPEASGVAVMSSVRFRGETKYSSLTAKASYQSLNKVLEPYYEISSDNNTKLESTAINLMTQLKNNKSIDQNLYQEYQLWLSSFKFN